MIFCNSLLFLHVPKTAGMSLTEVLLKLAPAPIYYTWPIPESRRRPSAATRSTIRDALERMTELPRKSPAGVVNLRGDRHEMLAEAATFVEGYGFKLDSFPVILAGLRNPYELEVSRFAFMLQGNEFDRSRNQRLAQEADFEAFARLSRPHAGAHRPFDAYYTLEGVTPPNMRLIRIEHIDRDLREALQSIDIELDCPVPHINESQHEDYRTYYTPAAEAAVYERYRWAFERGLYPRMVM